jgi:hypothetical protein
MVVPCCLYVSGVFVVSENTENSEVTDGNGGNTTVKLRTRWKGYAGVVMGLALSFAESANKANKNNPLKI